MINSIKSGIIVRDLTIDGRKLIVVEDERRRLWECYRSGQISEAAWQEHLANDPDLAREGDRE